MPLLAEIGVGAELGQGALKAPSAHIIGAVMPKDHPSSKPEVPAPQFPADRATAPMALERDSESAWALFERLRSRQDAAQTAPAPGYEPTEFLEVPGAAAAGLSGSQATLDEVMALARRNNRACPLPAPWAAFHDLLPARVGDGAKAPPPVDRQGWTASSAMHKRLRLRDQIEWADRTGVLQAAHDFLARLPEEHWHHFD